MPRAKISAEDQGYQDGREGKALFEGVAFTSEIHQERYRKGWIRGRMSVASSDPNVCPYCGEKPLYGWIVVDGRRTCGKHVDFRKFK